MHRAPSGPALVACTSRRAPFDPAQPARGPAEPVLAARTMHRAPSGPALVACTSRRAPFDLAQPARAPAEPAIVVRTMHRAPSEPALVGSPNPWRHPPALRTRSSTAHTGPEQLRRFAGGLSSWSSLQTIAAKSSADPRSPGREGPANA